MDTKKAIYTGINGAIRNKRGLTQEALAQKTNGLINVRTIQNYELGLTEAKASNLLILANILETTIDVLLKRPNNYSYALEDAQILPYRFNHLDNYVPNRDADPFDFGDNLNDSYTIGYHVLKEDNLLLNLAKDTTLIFEREIDVRDYFQKTKKKDFIGLLNLKDKNGNHFIHITRIVNSEHDRKKYNYLYFDQYDTPIHIGLEINDILVGVVKKSVCNY